MLPKRVNLLNKDVVYEWPQLVVKSSLFGDAVFASTTIPALTFIPYLGVMYIESSFPPSFINRLDQKYLQSTPLGGETIIIDGSPNILPWNRVGCKGLAIAAKINEPDKKTPPNCIFYDQATAGINLGGMVFVVTIEDIKIGDELTVCYGPDYAREYKTVNEICKSIIDLNKNKLFHYVGDRLHASVKSIERFPLLARPLFAGIDPPKVGMKKKRKISPTEKEIIDLTS